MGAAVVLPVRAFATGKARLKKTLDARARSDLGRRLATRVRAAAGAMPCFVVTSDDEVVAWAGASNASVVDDPGRGLDAAVRAGVDAAFAAGATHVIVAHADLARARDLAWIAEFDGVTIVTDRHGTGTNVLAFPAGVEFEFAYGPDSRAKHFAAATATGARVRVVEDDELGWDIDEPADLAVLGPNLALPAIARKKPCKH